MRNCVRRQVVADAAPTLAAVKGVEVPEGIANLEIKHKILVHSILELKDDDKFI